MVTDCDLFARATLGQLALRLADPCSLVAGWSLHQLLDRLEQVGAKVELEVKA